MFRSEGATQTSPMDTVASLSNGCSKVEPLLMVWSNPPLAVAIQYVEGSASKTEMAVMRPLILAGPMHRHVNDFAQLSGIVKFGGGTSFSRSLPLPFWKPFGC